MRDQTGSLGDLSLDYAWVHSDDEEWSNSDDSPEKENKLKLKIHNEINNLVGLKTMKQKDDRLQLLRALLGKDDLKDGIIPIHQDKIDIFLQSSKSMKRNSLADLHQRSPDNNSPDNNKILDEMNETNLKKFVR